MLENTGILVAGLSGGADSVCLVAVLKEIIEKGDIKGELTEKLVNNLAKEKKYKLLEGKYGSNNGIDHMFFSKDGKSLIILDSKQMMCRL